MAGLAVDLTTIVREAGIVGAGGAGFPTYAKFGNEVDTYIANGVECEPIMEADKHLMIESASDIVRGLELAMEQVGAGSGCIAIKKKNAKSVEAVSRAAAGKPNISVKTLDNFYPAGDEQILIRHITGRIVPPGGLPFMAGVTVNNVATLKQITDASDGIPVTSRLVTVGGEVARPVTVEAPIGTPIADLIAYAGGPAINEYEVILGGPIMGPVGVSNPPGDTPESLNGAVLTKVMGGVIVLPSDHQMVRLKKQQPDVTKMRAKTCTTCQECWILCPRNAMGHPIFPAKVMTYSFRLKEMLRQIEQHDLDPFTEEIVSEAMLCCQCGVCEQYACIFYLAPNRVYKIIQDAVRKAGLKFDYSKRMMDDSVFEYRKIPALTYARKIGVADYIKPTAFEPLGSLMPERVYISLRQHIGAPAVPVVNTGDTVKTGDLVGEIPPDSLGARLHASIDGRVAGIMNDHVVIERI